MQLDIQFSLKDKEKLTIFGQKWTLRLVSHDDPILEDNDGLCIYSKKIIAVNKDQNAREIFQTFFHEYFHATFKRTSLELNTKLEETIVDQLATANQELLFP